MPESPLEITVEEAHGCLLTPGSALFLDVREPAELAVARIEGSQLIPMRTVPNRIMELEDLDRKLIVFCHHGVRSLQVAAWLREHGVVNAQSMIGGIDAWSQRIDSTVPRY